VEAAVVSYARSELQQQVESEDLLEAVDWIRKAGHHETIRTLALDIQVTGTGTSIQ
jgi:hypothetical protein